MMPDYNVGSQGAIGMGSAIQQQIDTFSRYAQRTWPQLRCEVLCDYGFLLSPEAAVPIPGGKDIALTLIGLTHGNEWAGVAVLNEVLGQVAAGDVPLTAPVAFILGNPWAALENKRFLERDLNRCFGRAAPQHREELRAQVLSEVLQRTYRLVDFHQTMRPSDRAFFIFSYLPESLAFAGLVAPELTVVTHWSGGFSAEGMCSDEYVNKSGGRGITIELGQNGFDPMQIATGAAAARGAISAMAPLLLSRTEVPRFSPRELYTWAQIVPWPKAGVVTLDEGWDNFAAVEAGARLGDLDGQALLAPASGRMLFPKYLSREQQQVLAARPTELCRIMTLIELTDLPD